MRIRVRQKPKTKPATAQPDISSLKPGDIAQHLLDAREVLILEVLGRPETRRYRVRYLKPGKEGPEYDEGIFWASELCLPASPLERAAEMMKAGARDLGEALKDGTDASGQSARGQTGEVDGR